ncbi:hypothetical protein DFH06DRAFT_1298010 [Mycena polygramma]|nr:hypothetical protein DFH06DRAFT_1298010 [Mycena polygramma]
MSRNPAKKSIEGRIWRLKRSSRKELVLELRSEELSLPALCQPQAAGGSIGQHRQRRTGAAQSRTSSPQLSSTPHRSLHGRRSGVLRSLSVFVSETAKRSSWMSRRTPPSYKDALLSAKGCKGKLSMKRQLTEGLDTKSPTWHFHDPTHSPLAVFIFMGTVVDDADGQVMYHDRDEGQVGSESGPTLRARFAGKPIVSDSDPRKKNTPRLVFASRCGSWTMSTVQFSPVWAIANARASTGWCFWMSRRSAPRMQEIGPSIFLAGQSEMHSEISISVRFW